MRLRELAVPSGRQDLFAVGIEMDPALLQIRDVTEVRGLGGTVADPDIAVRSFPAADAVEEVLHVINRLVAGGLHNHRLRIAFGVELVPAASDIQPAFGPDQLD